MQILPAPGVPGAPGLHRHVLAIPQRNTRPEREPAPSPSTLQSVLLPGVLAVPRRLQPVVGYNTYNQPVESLAL